MKNEKIRFNFKVEFQDDEEIKKFLEEISKMGGISEIEIQTGDYEKVKDDEAYVTLKASKDGKLTKKQIELLDSFESIYNKNKKKK